MNVCVTSTLSTCPLLWDLRQGHGQPDWLRVHQLSVPRKMHIEPKISHTERCHHFTPAQAGAHTPTRGPRHRHANPSHLCPFWCWREFKMACPLLLCLQTSGSPTPEKFQLRGPQGCTGNALYALGQPGYFLSQDWWEVGPGAARLDILSCSVSFHGRLYSWQRVLPGLSVSLFLFEVSGQFI